MKFINKEIFKGSVLKVSFLLLALLICIMMNIGIIIVSTIITILVLVIISDILLYKKASIYVSNNDKKYIDELEKTLKNTKLVYDGWYITDNYMFSIYKLKKVDYKNIQVIEGSLCIRNSRINSIGWKQTIYLNDGSKFKLKSNFSSEDSEQLERIIKKSNPNVYFGVVEDYRKLQNINKKKL